MLLCGGPGGGFGGHGGGFLGFAGSSDTNGRATTETTKKKITKTTTRTTTKQNCLVSFFATGRRLGFLGSSRCFLWVSPLEPPEIGAGTPGENCPPSFVKIRLQDAEFITKHCMGGFVSTYGMYEYMYGGDVW